jgi:predicted lipoprotein
MKGMIKKATLVGVLVTLGACSSMTTIDVRETKANPKWYADCEQIGSEGFLFWKDKYAYACGMGESKYEQASESQAYAFAVKGFAERVNGVVNSSTVVDINGDNRQDRTRVEHLVKNTTIREHLEVKKYSYELASTGRVHTYVRIKMPLNVFDKLLAEAKNDKTAKTVGAIKHSSTD